MRIGIVGSRRRTDRDAVEACIAELAPDTVVVTGGARGPDRWAEQAARARDDLATSGWHIEESLTALRSLGASTSAFVWIGGTVT